MVSYSHLIGYSFLFTNKKGNRNKLIPISEECLETRIQSNFNLKFYYFFRGRGRPPSILLRIHVHSI